MKRLYLLTISLLLCVICFAQAKNYNIECKNPLNVTRTDVPIIQKLTDKKICSAMVLCGENEIPCQLDDLDGDGCYDELCFLADFGKKETKTFNIVLSDQGAPIIYEPRVYAEMLLNNPKEKGKRQTSYISSLTVDNDVNPYNLLQHHGPAFESELVSYRIYFDERQTVDIYGKYRKGLEIKQTQFYPTKEELANGFGDDCLWVGSTLGVGTLRGWDGNKQTFISKVSHRTERIIARGPLRTIVEVVDNDWQLPKGDAVVNMITRYTLYAGHRDVQVEVKYTVNSGRQIADNEEFCTGLINVKNSTEFSDKEGLRGCWGTDWPVSEKDSAGHKRETVGLGICIPKQYIVKELAADKDNYPFVVSPKDGQLNYGIAFCSDNESFGFHKDKDWYEWMKVWKREINSPITITLKD